jgi:hypothetical protein
MVARNYIEIILLIGITFAGFFWGVALINQSFYEAHYNYTENNKSLCEQYAEMHHMHKLTNDGIVYYPINGTLVQEEILVRDCLTSPMR